MIALADRCIYLMQLRLRAELPDAVAERNSQETTDDYELRLPTERQILNYAPPVSQLVDFPTIGMTYGRITFDDDTGEALTGVIPITVIAYEQDYDPATLAWKLQAWGSVLGDIILGDRNLGAGDDGGWGIVPISFDPGPTLTREEDPRELTSFCGFSFQVRAEQHVG